MQRLVLFLSRGSSNFLVARALLDIFSEKYHEPASFSITQTVAEGKIAFHDRTFYYTTFKMAHSRVLSNCVLRTSIAAQSYCSRKCYSPADSIALLINRPFRATDGSSNWSAFSSPARITSPSCDSLDAEKLLEKNDSLDRLFAFDCTKTRRALDNL